MNKMTIRRRTHDGMLQEGGRDMLVSLPAPPFPLDVTSDRPETDPRSMPIKGKMDRRFVRNMARVQR